MAPANPELRELVKEMNRSGLVRRFKSGENQEPLRAEGEIFPSDVVPVLASNKAGQQRVFPMKWGFSMKTGLLINARAETAALKQTFREAWESHRCVIPASWYFEWEHDGKNRPGKKYAMKQESESLIWFAGLYRMENDIPAFVILTRPAVEKLAWMHDRMPVMIPRSEIGEWIRPESRPDEMIGRCLTEIYWEDAI